MDEAISPEPRYAGAVRRVQEGDAEPFADLVTGFQDMAVGYAWSILGDFHLAEDAVQEAFLDAYRHIRDLREPLAFPGWLRRILFKHCDRFTRKNAPATVSFEEAGDEPAEAPSPEEAMESHEMRDRLMAALDDLTERQRNVLVLHHMSGHSLAEISAFLGVPVPRVKKRLHDARARLREIVVDSLADRLRARRPSQDPAFARGVIEVLDAARRGDADRVKTLLQRNPRLRHGRDFMGNTALIIAAACGHRELAALLLESGAPVDLHEAAAIGETRRVAAILDANPGSLDAFSDHGFTAIGLAAHFGRIETLRLLLDRGAEVNVVSKHPIGATPLIGALFGRQAEAAMLLIDRGADATARRGGKGWPRAGWTPLHYASAYGFRDVIIKLLERGADPAAKDDAGTTPLDAARDAGHEEAVRLLRKGEVSK